MGRTMSRCENCGAPYYANAKEQRRIRDLIESATFALGAAGQEIHELQRFIDQAGPLLRPLIDMMKDEG